MAAVKYHNFLIASVLQKLVYPSKKITLFIFLSKIAMTLNKKLIVGCIFFVK
jgi:hypothetical protein